MSAAVTASYANTYAEASRLKKAYELARVLHRGGVTVEMSKRMTQDEWKTLAAACKVNVPSERSQELTIEKLAKLYEPLEAF